VKAYKRFNNLIRSLSVKVSERVSIAESERVSQNVQNNQTNRIESVADESLRS